MRVLRTLSTAPGKAKVLQKEALARAWSHLAPVYLVNEYPKSGGTWLKFMLAEALGLPAWTQGAPAWGSCVMQAHWLQARGGCRTVALFRDGRDVMVSYYFHSFFVNEFNNAAYTRYMRDRFGFADYEDTQTNLLPFMKVMIDDPVSPRFSWIDFVRAWAGRPGVVDAYYDRLRQDTGAELDRVVTALTGTPLPRGRAAEVAAGYTMEKMRARKAELNPLKGPRQAAEKSFIRKGSVGGWTEHFTDEALDWFEGRAGAELTRLGYRPGRPEGHDG